VTRGLTLALLLALGGCIIVPHRGPEFRPHPFFHPFIR